MQKIILKVLGMERKLASLWGSIRSCQISDKIFFGLDQGEYNVCNIALPNELNILPYMSFLCFASIITCILDEDVTTFLYSLCFRISPCWCIPRICLCFVIFFLPKHAMNLPMLDLNEFTMFSINHYLRTL